MTAPAPVVAVLGASGLIGHALALDLTRRGFAVLPVARRFTEAQKAALEDACVQCPIAALDGRGLAQLFEDRSVDIVVNCLGVLQDGPGGGTDDVHRGLTERLLQALASRATLLVHVSVPGRPEDDRTPFSRSKREAERLIVASSVPFAILRPGFVVAPAAYGGSALIRALAALPLELPAAVADRPLAAVAMADLSTTVAFIAARWRAGERRWGVAWDVMEPRPGTVGDVVGAFRRSFGGPTALLRLPAALLGLGARAGDIAASLGWRPPIRTTALQELRRGVAGDPEPWIAATGIEPSSLAQTLTALPATVQERWFARLYLAKPAILVCLALFWIASGLIALTVAFDAAAGILVSHGFALRLAQAVTIVSSLLDIGVGVAIGVRPTCRMGLWAGILTSLVYMIGAALITPELWVEPLGALVKTGPAVVLMGVALAILDDR